MMTFLRNLHFERIFFFFFVLSFLLGSYRIVGYFLYDIPYGYDPGFFRHAIGTSLAALPGLPGSPDPYLPYHEPLFGILSTILSFIGFSPDVIIGPLLGFLSVFTALCIYFLAKQSFSRSVGIVAASIFLLSIVQYQEYWWNYWRNIVGIIFLLISLGLLLRRSPLAVLTIAGLFTIHRPSALYFAVVVILFLLIQIVREKKIPWNQLTLILGGGVLALPLYANQMSFLTDMIGPISTTIGGTTSSGTFFTSREFFFFIFPYFLILIPAIFRKMDKREFDIVFIGFLVGLAWSVLRLFFYNRMFVFFDLFAILLAAYGITYIIRELPRHFAYGIIIVFFSVQGYLYTTHAHTFASRHTISREEFDIVRNLDILVPKDAAILSTYRGYTPWLLGYSDRKTLAPGLLADQIWDEATWNRFYYEADDATRCTMIADYQKLAPELYVFVGDEQPPLRLPSTCFRPILSNTSHPIIYEVLWK